ncbi:MAG: hypothetical protein HC933_22540 [Pleurocapsa sp. SU_196_0]|nr:hypothetical protein [Pleurocapsa sp. SU_196_0]
MAEEFQLTMWGKFFVCLALSWFEGSGYRPKTCENTPMKHVLLAALVVSSLSIVAVNAQGELSFFQTPSGNIHCLFDPEERVLRCDLAQFDGKPLPRPKDCELDWGNSFYLAARGKPGGVCHGDTVMAPNNPKLGYGKSWSKSGITCVSRQTGLRCVNLDRRGFELSRAAVKFF